MLDRTFLSSAWSRFNFFEKKETVPPSEPSAPPAGPTLQDRAITIAGVAIAVLFVGFRIYKDFHLQEVFYNWDKQRTIAAIQDSTLGQLSTTVEEELRTKICVTGFTDLQKVRESCHVDQLCNEKTGLEYEKTWRELSEACWDARTHLYEKTSLEGLAALEAQSESDPAYLGVAGVKICDNGLGGFQRLREDCNTYILCDQDTVSELERAEKKVNEACWGMPVRLLRNYFKDGGLKNDLQLVLEEANSYETIAENGENYIQREKSRVQYCSKSDDADLMQACNNYRNLLKGQYTIASCVSDCYVLSDSDNLSETEKFDLECYNQCLDDIQKNPEKLPEIFRS